MLYGNSIYKLLKLKIYTKTLRRMVRREDYMEKRQRLLHPRKQQSTTTFFLNDTNFKKQKKKRMFKNDNLVLRASLKR